MKLAEALQERADTNRKIEELKSRLQNSILVQEGEDPAEDPAELLQQLSEATERLEWLMRNINLTNSRTRVKGTTLTAMIAKKDVLTIRLAAYRQLASFAGQSTDRARGTEIKIKAVIKASELQRVADQTAKELRELDNLLQETNWKTKLME